ncbi:MAG TPA: tetratricopeptide repeat protein, partial [Pirellulaceae bacterium]|nr:tetratricopeptide repeat protein [Pirellulaceae bacterium]
AGYSQLQNGGKDNPKQAAALASIYNELGEVYRSSHEHDQAREAFDQARVILEPIATKSSPPEVRYELARSFYLKIHRFDGTPPGPGFGSSNNKRGGARRDGKNEPSKRQGDGGRSGDNFWRGEFARDSETIERAVALLEELTDEFQVPDYQQLLALCYAERHRHLRFVDRTQSEESIAKAIGLLEDLVARYPQNPDYRFTLSTVYVKGLRDFWTRPSAEELADIEARATTALELLHELHRDHPGVPEYVMSELEVRRSLANRLRDAGRFEDARPHFKAAIALFDSLSESEASDGGNIMRAAITTNFYADMLLEQYRKVKEAGGEPPVESISEAREVLQSWVNEMRPHADSDPRYYMAVGFSYKRLAAIFTELGDSEAAATATHDMQTYLPEDKWVDSPRSGERGSLGGERGPSNRPRPPKQDGTAKKSS